MVQEGDVGGGGDKPKMYRIAFPEKAGPMNNPVKGYSGRAAIRTSMKVHY